MKKIALISVYSTHSRKHMLSSLGIWFLNTDL